MATHSPPFHGNVLKDLIPKLTNALEVAQNESTSQAKQATYQATSAFKDSLLQARKMVAYLPGGELSIDEQREIITMLEQLRDGKRLQLTSFSEKALMTNSLNNAHHKTSNFELDSTASSPRDDS